MRWIGRYSSHSLHFATALFLSAAISACSGSSEIEAADTDTDNTTDSNVDPVTNEPSVVLITRQSGGCIRIGPNCAVHTLYNDGSVDVRRDANGKPEENGQIDIGLLNSWLDLVSQTDFTALIGRLPTGQCASCFDGIDYEYEIAAADSTVVFKSIDVQFDVTEPFFNMTNGIYEAMQNAAPLMPVKHQ